ncbi:MAG TPA: phosphoribosyltransferase family protein [Chitinophagales bacterium]|nr:phosphoribosyltransferase [Chitinophagales bacterium]HMV03440.1 phosphoribosyltransferase family protein [Chitinophagales bacterium]HMW94927.1 phosphoribosyltransferase family protein [Chitinophagales bacterium]HMY42920.1 phosphoribosyltransferase family protein [Chitinophagales bacterium]HMZ68923.1 phosphoribosyltransferase family protein [Chitinophagales bacterium]
MEIPASAQKILNAETAALKVDRIVFQILENTFHSPEIVMIGIKDGGYIIAEKIAEKINHYYPEKKIALLSLTIDKINPVGNTILLEPNSNLEGKTIVLIDDVANTGKTMFYTFNELTKYKIEKLITCVLIDRTHKKFPIQSDIVGLQMATTFNEHIIVKIENNEIEGAYLF